MVAEPSVNTLTTALANLTAGSDSIGQALATLKHDVDEANALAGVNLNTKVFESINVQVLANFEEVKQVIGANLEMAKIIGKLEEAVDKLSVDKEGYDRIIAGVSITLADAIAMAKEPGKINDREERHRRQRISFSREYVNCSREGTARLRRLE